MVVKIFLKHPVYGRELNAAVILHHDGSRKKGLPRQEIADMPSQ
jgi:hypothetical protein